jgi:ectoine hydroxylase-related dioxygenase (phytanoyl-CoA dioxygenase family)
VIRHPWNDGFTWDGCLPATGPTTLTAEQKAAFDGDGFVVVPDVVAPDQLAEVTAELDELEAEVDRFLATQADGRISIAEAGAITFTVHCVLRSAAARRLAQHPTLAGLCADLLGPDANLYWDQAVYKKPEKPRRFPWHQDTGYTFVEPQHYLTCWLALTDATAANGCPHVLPGVHRHGTLLHHWVDPIGWECLDADADAAEIDAAVVAEVPAGGVVAFSSLTPHLTGPNTTGAVRKAYILQYAVPGMRVVEGDWLGGGPPTGSKACDDPDRQFPILRGGRTLGP